MHQVFNCNYHQHLPYYRTGSLPQIQRSVDVFMLRMQSIYAICCHADMRASKKHSRIRNSYLIESINAEDMTGSALCGLLPLAMLRFCFLGLGRRSPRLVSS